MSTVVLVDLRCLAIGPYFMDLCVDLTTLESMTLNLGLPLPVQSCPPPFGAEFISKSPTTSTIKHCYSQVGEVGQGFAVAHPPSMWYSCTHIHHLPCATERRQRPLSCSTVCCCVPVSAQTWLAVNFIHMQLLLISIFQMYLMSVSRDR